MHRRHIRMFGLTVLALSLSLLAACGGSDTDTTEPTPAPSPATIQPTVVATPTPTIEDVPTQAPEPTPSPVNTTEISATETLEATAVPEVTATQKTDTPSPTPEDRPTALAPGDPSPTIPPVATAIPPPPPTSVTGEGTAMSDPVNFPVGVAVVTMHFTGSNFSRVQMLSQDGDFDRFIGNGRGTWKGSFAIPINDAGEYVFEVESEGPWQIDVLWPTPETASVSEVPFEQSGAGDQAVYFVLVQTGTHTLTLTHDGEGPYSMKPVTSEGRLYIDQLSGNGATSASIEFTINNTAFEFLILNIRADANWTVAIE